MKQTKQQKRDKRNKLTFKALLVVISATIIVYFMPRTNDFSYSYAEGRLWTYGQLFAAFKFPVLKDASVRQSEQDSLIRNLQPYYTMSPSVVTHAHMQLKDITSKTEIEGGSKEYVKFISRMLDYVYSHGVLSTSEYADLVNSRAHNVFLVTNNVAVTAPAAQLYSTRSAYEFIMNVDTIHYSRKVLQHYNINTLLKPNVVLDEEKTSHKRSDALGTLDAACGWVAAGEKIIDRGEVVTPEIYRKLESYKHAWNERRVETQQIPYNLIGQIIIVLIVLISLCTYVNIFRRDYFDTPRAGILLYGLLTIDCVIAGLMLSHNLLNIFMLPCCMVPIIIRVFLDSRTAFMFHCGMVIIISLMLEYNYEFLIMQIAAGMIAIQTLRELSQRSQIFNTAFIIAVTMLLVYASYIGIIENDIYKIDSWRCWCIAINGSLLLLTYPLLWLIEKAFGFTSDVTLVELSNINNPLLQQMSEVAPGTFQHSLQVANLCSEVAKKIGGKAQLVRTGAMYHDIGKIERPVFFTENQNGASPHKHLTPEKSAMVIIAHVTNGLALADKHQLPPVIKRFITTHHGAGKAKYFYITYKNEHPDEEIDEKVFTYPGPNPASKEEAILMMADSVEAASRSLPEYTEESISALVDRIIDAQVGEGFFAECDITFHEIATAKNVFKEKLKIVYHTRITYPELTKNN